MSKIVERTLNFLELFAEEKRPLSLSEISRLLNIPVSSCHDVLQALQDRGYLYELAPRAGYYPTLRFKETGQTIADHDPVVMHAGISLRALHDRVGESVLLAKINGLRGTYLLSYQPVHPLPFQIYAGDTVRHIYATSAGRAILGRLEPKDLTAALKTLKLVPLTRHTITSKAALREEVKRGVKNKWFLNREETQDGVTKLSSTFRWNGSNYIVTIAGAASRLEPGLTAAAEALVDLCDTLSMQPPR